MLPCPQPRLLHQPFHLLSVCLLHDVYSSPVRLTLLLSSPPTAFAIRHTAPFTTSSSIPLWRLASLPLSLQHPLSRYASSFFFPRLLSPCTPSSCPQCPLARQSKQMEEWMCHPLLPLPMSSTATFPHHTNTANHFLLSEHLAFLCLLAWA